MRITDKHLAGKRPVSSRLPGFTLPELLVTIIVLAVFSTAGFGWMKLVAANCLTTNGWHLVYVGVGSWASEKNSNDPAYEANGTGTHGRSGNGSRMEEVSLGKSITRSWTRKAFIELENRDII
ncbi:MAG: prepilin-type N-terminal cleavage/methylation domain-containing protein [Luteolibacter sp.]|uniref:pilus assembly FimT family protein n=1 Tax=Luteolibacter sp. TaxID=1962973 RepID=UPI003262DAB2